MTDEPGNTAGRNTMHTLAGPSDFPTTRWTLVIAAADTQRKDARSALVSLCEGYWYPLYAYIRDRKSTRLNSSHLGISYAVFCLKKRNKTHMTNTRHTLKRSTASISLCNIIA